MNGVEFGTLIGLTFPFLFHVSHMLKKKIKNQLGNFFTLTLGISTKILQFILYHSSLALLTYVNYSLKYHTYLIPRSKYFSRQLHIGRSRKLKVEDVSRKFLMI